MSAFTQDNDYLYIDLASLPNSNFPSLSQNVQLLDQVFRAFKSELVLNNNLIFNYLDPITLYRYINQELVDKTILAVIIQLDTPELDPDQVING